MACNFFHLFFFCLKSPIFSISLSSWVLYNVLSLNFSFQVMGIFRSGYLLMLKGIRLLFCALPNLCHLFNNNKLERDAGLLLEIMLGVLEIRLMFGLMTGNILLFTLVKNSSFKYLIQLLLLCTLLFSCTSACQFFWKAMIFQPKWFVIVYVWIFYAFMVWLMWSILFKILLFCLFLMSENVKLKVNQNYIWNWIKKFFLELVVDDVTLQYHP